jgi:hypothetical protein
MEGLCSREEGQSRGPRAWRAWGPNQAGSESLLIALAQSGDSRASRAGQERQEEG